MKITKHSSPRKDMNEETGNTAEIIRQTRRRFSPTLDAVTDLERLKDIDWSPAEWHRLCFCPALMIEKIALTRQNLSLQSADAADIIVTGLSLKQEGEGAEDPHIGTNTVEGIGEEFRRYLADRGSLPRLFRYLVRTADGEEYRVVFFIEQRDRTSRRSARTGRAFAPRAGGQIL